MEDLDYQESKLLPVLSFLGWLAAGVALVAALVVTNVHIQKAFLTVVPTILNNY